MAVAASTMEVDQDLPGFRFHPTDQELVGFFLRRKVLLGHGGFIPEVDLYKFEPDELPGIYAPTVVQFYSPIFCIAPAPLTPQVATVLTANSTPQTEQRASLGLRSPSPSSRGFLWLARWPPRAWNDGNTHSHVLHLNVRSHSHSHLQTMASLAPAT